MRIREHQGASSPFTTHRSLLAWWQMCIGLYRCEGSVGVTPTSSDLNLSRIIRISLGFCTLSSAKFSDFQVKS